MKRFREQRDEINFQLQKQRKLITRNNTLIKKDYEVHKSKIYKDLPVLEFDKVLLLYDLFEGKFNFSLQQYQNGRICYTDFKRGNFQEDFINAYTHEQYELYKEVRLKEMNEFFQPAPFDFVVYRCVKKLYEEKLNYCDNGFTSTSLVPHVDFCRLNTDLMIIHIKKGYPIYFYATPNEYSYQFEVLLQPACFRNIKKHGNIYTYELDPYKRDLEQEKLMKLTDALLPHKYLSKFRTREDYKKFSKSF